jgi:hypothetical protein
MTPDFDFEKMVRKGEQFRMPEGGSVTVAGLAWCSELGEECVVVVPNFESRYGKYIYTSSFFFGRDADGEKRFKRVGDAPREVGLDDV